MRFSNALIVSASLGKFASDAYVIRPHRNHKSYNLLVKKPSSLYGTAGDWDNDDFLDSLGKAAKDEPEEPKEQQPSRFVQLNAIKEQGNAAGNKPPNALGAPPSFTDLADSLINSPSQQPNPQFQPAGYPPPPPVDPNNPYAAYPPPPPVDPNNPYAVYPPPPPPNPQDPNAPPPSYPAYPYPYPPPPYPPPPEGADPNDPSQPPPVYNPYAAYGYPPPPPQQQAPPPPPKPQSRVMDGQRVGRNRDADAIANTADLYFAQLKLDSKIRKKAFLAGDVETSNKPFADERVRILKETLQDNPHIMAERKRAHEEEQSFLESPVGRELFQATKTDSSFERKVTNSDYSGQSYRAKLFARTGKKLRSTPIPKPEPPVAESQ